jgi:quercetin dioxygenase-like cupin family protein
MTISKLIFVLVCLGSSNLIAQEPGAVTPLLSKDLTGIPNKEGQMVVVDYAPGGADSMHRHKAHVFVYVLKGAVVMQVKGGKEVTVGAGETFYEGPDDIHLVSRNASDTQSAKFLVFFVKDKGAPVLIPASP